MKKIKDRHSFVNGTIFSVIGIVLLCVYFIVSRRTFLVAGAFSLLFAASLIVKAFYSKGIVEEAGESADERDLFLTMRCSKTTIRILNYLCYAACIISLILYGIFKSPLLLAVAGTACAFIIVMFIVFLCANLYYEKRL